MKSQFISKRPFVIKNGIKGRGVFATNKIHKGTILFKMYGEIITQPTQTSVQLGEDIHIEDELASLVNHSCDPSAKVDRHAQAFTSLRDIEKNEEITFDYAKNEDVLAEPFTCECCNKKICGKN